MVTSSATRRVLPTTISWLSIFAALLMVFSATICLPNAQAQGRQDDSQVLTPVDQTGQTKNCPPWTDTGAQSMAEDLKILKKAVAYFHQSAAFQNIQNQVKTVLQDNGKVADGATVEINILNEEDWKKQFAAEDRHGGSVDDAKWAWDSFEAFTYETKRKDKDGNNIIRITIFCKQDMKTRFIKQKAGNGWDLYEIIVHEYVHAKLYSMYVQGLTDLNQWPFRDHDNDYGYEDEEGEWVDNVSADDAKFKAEQDKLLEMFKNEMINKSKNNADGSFTDSYVASYDLERIHKDGYCSLPSAPEDGVLSLHVVEDAGYSSYGVSFADDQIDDVRLIKKIRDNELTVFAELQDNPVAYLIVEEQMLTDFATDALGCEMLNESVSDGSFIVLTPTESNSIYDYVPRQMTFSFIDAFDDTPLEDAKIQMFDSSDNMVAEFDPSVNDGEYTGVFAPDDYYFEVSTELFWTDIILQETRVISTGGEADVIIFKVDLVIIKLEYLDWLVYGAAALFLLGVASRARRFWRTPLPGAAPMPPSGGGSGGPVVAPEPEDDDNDADGLVDSASGASVAPPFISHSPAPISPPQTLAEEGLLMEPGDLPGTIELGPDSDGPALEEIRQREAGKAGSEVFTPKQQSSPAEILGKPDGGPGIKGRPVAPPVVVAPTASRKKRRDHKHSSLIPSQLSENIKIIEHGGKGHRDGELASKIWPPDEKCDLPEESCERLERFEDLAANSKLNFVIHLDDGLNSSGDKGDRSLGQFGNSMGPDWDDKAEDIYQKLIDGEISEDEAIVRISGGENMEIPIYISRIDDEKARDGASPLTTLLHELTHLEHIVSIIRRKRDTKAERRENLKQLRKYCKTGGMEPEVAYETYLRSVESERDSISERRKGIIRDYRDCPKELKERYFESLEGKGEPLSFKEFKRFQSGDG